MIELGLARINQLLKHTPLTWRAIHVAGTNGKGSVTAYLSALLKEGGLSVGRFNSPHLIDRWDCISVNESTVQQSFFQEVEKEVKTRNKRLQIGASEFEILTATAFEIFNRAKVKVGVVEVGVGGRLDATNALSKTDVLVSVITRIGLDHQNLLGNTIHEIAREKGGVMKPGVPCTLDGTNTTEVIASLQAVAHQTESSMTIVTPDSSPDTFNLLTPYFEELDMEPHQRTNLLLAVEALKLTRQNLPLNQSVPELLHCIPQVQWPGRLQTINIKNVTGRENSVLLDGAHNVQSAEVLSVHVNRKLRLASAPVTWVLAASKGKNFEELISCLVKPGDNVIATRFGPVVGMPWVESVDTAEIISTAHKVSGMGLVVEANDGGDVHRALTLAANIACEGPLVIAGSLYLVSDVLRYLRAARETEAQSL